MIRFIRHSETESNVKLTTERNSKLTIRGIELCKQLTGHYDLVICSTLWRTRETLNNSNITYDTLFFSDLIRIHI